MLKKKLSLWDTLKFYNIIPLLIFGIILYLVRDYAIQAFNTIGQVSERSMFYKWMPYVTYIGLVTLWVFISFTTIRNKRYFYLTGRNYGYDSGHYRPMMYSQLVDYFKDADPHKLDTTPFPAVKWQDAKGLIFGKDKNRLIHIPSNSETNIAIFGPPGSGKTSGIAIINALRFQGSVLAIDIKGDIYNFCHKFRKIIRFCPDSPNALKDSCHFNPLAGIKDMDVTDKKLYIESMATVLIPDEGGSDGNYFSSRARKYFQGIVHLLLYDKPETTFPEIIHAILTGNCFDWVTNAMLSECNEAKELLIPFYGNNEKNVSGAYDNLCTAMTPFSNPVLDELLTDNGKCISINALEKGYDVYLQITQEHLDAYAPLFTLIVQSFSTAFTKRPDSSTGAKNRPILMLLDEFPALTYSYKMINSNLSTLRSKAIICMIIQQNMAQLEYRYQPTGARSIIGNCNYQIILGSNDINSSKVFSDTFGTHKVLIVGSSESSSTHKTNSRSIQQAREPIFFPEDFGDLDKEMVIYFKGKHCRCRKLNCYTDK